MVALALITALSVAWLRIAAGERRLLREQQQRLEAGCLADSGLTRAAARLAADPNYRGETWHVAAESLGGRSAASVAIEIAPDDARPNARRVRVVANYPDSGPGRVRRSKQRIIVLSKAGSQP